MSKPDKISAHQRLPTPNFELLLAGLEADDFGWPLDARPYLSEFTVKTLLKLWLPHGGRACERLPAYVYLVYRWFVRTTAL